MLRMLAGFEDPDEGDLLIDGRLDARGTAESSARESCRFNPMRFFPI